MTTKKPGKKIDKLPVWTEKRKLMVDIMLNAKSSSFWAEVDGILYSSSDLNVLKEMVKKDVFDKDRQVFSPYIQFEIKKDRFWHERGFDGSDIALHFSPILLTEPDAAGARLSREAWYEDSGDDPGLKWHEDDRGHKYSQNCHRLIAYTDKRYVALLEICKAIDTLRDRLKLLLGEQAPEIIEAALDHMTVQFLLSAQSEP